MNFKDILELIDKVADRGIAGIEIEQAGTKVRIEGKTAGPQVFHSYAGDMGGPAVTRLNQPVVVAGGEEQDLLPVCGLHHLADVVHDE